MTLLFVYLFYFLIILMCCITLLFTAGIVLMVYEDWKRLKEDQRWKR